jgi:HK97 family phage major capsid protein
VSPKTPVPADASELEEMLNERDTRLGDVMHAYIAEQTELVRAQLTEGMQTTLADMVKGVPAGGTGNVTAPGLSAGVTPEMMADAERARFYNGRVPLRDAVARNKLFGNKTLGAALDTEPYAASIGSFLEAIWHRAEIERPDQLETIRDYRRGMSNALSERVPSQGGFLLPEVLRSQILMVALEQAIVRPRARIIPMDSLRVPYPTIDDTSHTSSVYGGVIGYWAEEAAALTASQPAFGRIELEAHKLTGYTQIPNELLHDAVQALDQWFSEMFPIALAWFEDVAFIAGSGSGQPQGYQNSPCAVKFTRKTPSHVRFGDFAGMYARMIPASMKSATWVVSPDCIPELLQMAVTEPAGTTVAPPVFLNGMSSSGAPDMTILGRPVLVTEKHPAMGTLGDVAFVDFGYYLLGDRQSMVISSSEHYQFANDLTVFRVVERLDGRTWLQSAITPENNSANTLSPVVLLN